MLFAPAMQVEVDLTLEKFSNRKDIKMYTVLWCLQTLDTLDHSWYLDYLTYQSEMRIFLKYDIAEVFQNKKAEASWGLLFAGCP